VRSFDPDEDARPSDDELPARDVRDDLREADRDAVLAALDTVTSSLPGAERRDGQREMAVRVADAVAGHRPLVVEAGTGIGKSLAYLVPVALSGRRTVVATATKALQDQLVGKDVPSLVAAGVPLDAAALKGRQNYLCRQRLQDVGADGAATLDLDDGADPKGLVDQLRRIAVWSEQTETGERDHLGFEADPRAWARVSMPAEECPGADRCPFGVTCFAEAAKRRAESADVVVVNAALYGAHLSTGRTLLPAHEVVVFDEAHELDNQLSRSLGVELSAGRLRGLAQLARHSGAHDATGLADELTKAADRLASVLGERLARGAATGLDDATRAVLDDAARAAERLVEAAEALPASAGADLRRWSLRGAAVHLRGDLVRLRDPGGDDLVFLEGTERQATLVRAPIDVGPLLAPLWAEATAVLCSATMPEGLERRLGLGGATRCELPSPFDYATHSLLYVPRHLPDRRDPDAEALLADELAALVEAAGGRTLALFTSRRALEEVGRRVRERVATPVLCQGEQSRARLLKAFADDEATSLFATMGFWQGVDVPGRTLTLLAIDRLPFGRPDDPMLQARRERAGEAAFRTVDVPRAAMLLAQGVGRLIRTAEDRGVVCVLDTRLATATYRGQLLARLPPMRRTVSRDEVVAFLREATATVA
jgi:ATP-dependent DNA helicase DinG